MQSRKSILMNLQLCYTIDFFQLQQVLSTYIIQIGVYLRIRGGGIFVGESIGFHPNVHRCLSSISIGNMSRFWSINWWSHGRSGSLMVWASWPAKRRIRQQLLIAIPLPPPWQPSLLYENCHKTQTRYTHWPCHLHWSRGLWTKFQNDIFIFTRINSVTLSLPSESNLIIFIDISSDILSGYYVCAWTPYWAACPPQKNTLGER